MGINQSKDGTEGNAVSEGFQGSTPSGRSIRSPKLEDSNNNNFANGMPSHLGTSVGGNQVGTFGASGSKMVDGRHVLDGDLDSTVPTVFKWEHGGREVGQTTIA
jgi:hypothetical protein